MMFADIENKPGYRFMVEFTGRKNKEWKYHAILRAISTGVEILHEVCFDVGGYIVQGKSTKQFVVTCPECLKIIGGNITLTLEGRDG